MEEETAQTKKPLKKITAVWVQPPGETGERVSATGAHGLVILCGTTPGAPTFICEAAERGQSYVGPHMHGDADECLAVIYNANLTDIEWKDVDGDSNETAN